MWLSAHDGEGDSDAGEKEQGRSADQERHAQEDRRPKEDGCIAEACGTKEDRGEKGSGSEEGSGPEEAGHQESHNPEEGSDPEGHCEEGHSSCLVSGCVSARNDTCSSGRNAVRSHRDAGQSRIQADHASRAGRFHPYFILIDSPQVGSPPREGEVLEVIQGKVSVSYRVQWSDGHQTLIAPKGGAARIVRASERA